MGIEENKEIVRQAFSLLSQRKVDTSFEFFAPEYIEHTTETDMSWEVTKQAVKEFQQAFTDGKVTFDLMVGEDDMVAVRETITGTHTGEFGSVSPTGKQIKICNNFIVKVANGKIIEGWSTFDSMSLMQQIGAIPSQK
ncbi:MAG: ester cyclase [Dehalococcoidales bacterium]|nr:MAG: ester cyclase [Dehalococcoidales bacterium]